MVTFLPRQDGGFTHIDKNQKGFQFVGTNDVNCDESSRWSVLCEDLDAPEIDSGNLASLTEERKCRVEAGMEAEAEPEAPKFRCLGLKIIDTFRVGRQAGKTSLSRIHMWHRD